MNRQRHRENQASTDWLTPFVPPVLRVNQDTRDLIRHKLKQLISIETLETVYFAFKTHRRTVVLIVFATFLWIRGLVYIHYNDPEFAVAYVILSGFTVLGYNLIIGGNRDSGEISAYSVFNRGAQRMLGSLSAEQFENEIRHRHPNLDDNHSNQLVRRPENYEIDDEDDPELMEALRMSLQEKKRDDRRARRSSRRK